MYIVGYLIDTTKAFEVSSGVQFYLAVENIESHCPITGVRLIRLDAYNRRTFCCMSEWSKNLESVMMLFLLACSAGVFWAGESLLL